MLKALAFGKKIRKNCRHTDRKIRGQGKKQTARRQEVLSKRNERHILTPSFCMHAGAVASWGGWKTPLQRVRGGRGNRMAEWHASRFLREHLDSISPFDLLSNRWMDGLHVIVCKDEKSLPRLCRFRWDVSKI